MIDEKEGIETKRGNIESFDTIKPKKTKTHNFLKSNAKVKKTLLDFSKNSSNKNILKSRLDS